MHKLDEEAQKKYLGYMIRDTERLSVNVNQILNLARLEDKKYEPSWEIGNIVSFLKEWVEKSNHWSEEADVVLVNDKEDFSDPGLFVKYDKNLLPLVFMNLVNNALIYNQSDRPKIEIKVSKKEKNIVVGFSDNGIGIPNAYAKKVFLKFYQVAKTGKGSGIGLYLVQTVMRFHRGNVGLYSKGEGEGSTFLLTFPQSKESK
jgi:signal transduction histidine kinase